MRLPVVLSVIVAALFAASRGLPFIVWPHSAFDADQAIVGLMAKHLAEARAFPLFYYGQPYMLGVQAWLAAPLFLVAGVSIAMLKLPLLIVNGAVAGLLTWLLVRETTLRAFYALAVASLFFACTPAVGAQLVAAMGGSVEPFLYVLLIWLLRNRPVACGFLAGFGFLHREFTIYGIGALFVIDVFDRERTWRERAMKWVLIVVAFLACIQVVRVIRPYGDMFGPDLPQLQMPERASTFYAITTRLACAAPEEVGANVRWLFTENLPTLVGASGRTPNLYYAGAPTPSRPWLLGLIVFSLVAACSRVVYLWWREGRAPPPFATFLLVVAVQSCVFYVGSCDVRGPMLVRYTMLALLAPIAVASAYLSCERHKPARAVAVLLLLAFVAVNGVAYAAVVNEYVALPPESQQANVARRLEADGIRYARADYWDAYYISFVTNERVIVSATPQRILVYESLVSRADRVMYVQRTPCPDAEVVGRYWLCLHENAAADDGPAIPSALFPSQVDVLRFRRSLEDKYLTGLKRAPEFADDGEAAALWMQEYLRYRLSGCEPDDAEAFVVEQIQGSGAQPTCGAITVGAVPRDELLAFRRRVPAMFAAPPDLPQTMTAVDPEGEVVWLQEYVLRRLDGCRHDEAMARVTDAIDGSSPRSGC